MGTLLVRGPLTAALLLTFVFPVWAQDGKGIGVVTALTGHADLKRPQAPQAQTLKLRDNLFSRMPLQGGSSTAPQPCLVL